MRESEERFRTLCALGPVAVYYCDASGVIQNFNRRAEEFWGRALALGDTDERFCGSFRMFRLDGSFMPHEQCPMADVVSGKIQETPDQEVFIERPDGSQITVVVNIVSATNCVRQPFSENDIGQNKAIVLINRINQFWGTRWNAAAIPFRATTLRRNTHWTPDLLIGCVDSKKARLSIRNALTGRGLRSTYWLDIGDSSSSGQ